jgi:phosphatidylglycerol lysyltransferase
MENFDCAVVRKAGVVVAFANLWRAGTEEISVDLMRFNDAAPKGVMDYLFVETILYGQAQGYKWFSLGMAPLSGLESHELASTWHRVGHTIFEHGESFYNFEGLRAFKDKFDPEWEPRYLAAPGGLATPRVMYDAAVLISGGLKEIFVR